MSHKGFCHIGLSTLDLDKTRDFYENVLGFKPVRCDIIKIREGGQGRYGAILWAKPAVVRPMQ
jgi:catechol 2,3-dioxygenase-like lactoylglutathione lyase family enzyme